MLPDGADAWLIAEVRKLRFDLATIHAAKPVAYAIFLPKGSEYNHLVFANLEDAESKAVEMGEAVEIVPLYSFSKNPFHML